MNIDKLAQGPMTFSSANEEILHLRQEIANHRLEAKNFENRIKPEDHAKDVLREHYSKLPEKVLGKPMLMGDLEKKKFLQNLQPRKTDEQVSDLVGIMLLKGVHNVISLVKEMRKSELEDDFHRFLINFLLAPHEDLEKKLDKKELQALHLKLYEIILPDRSEEQNKNPKEFMALMEQFYAAMLAIAYDNQNTENNYYTLEIAKPNDSQEVSFFVSAPKEMSDLFEKTILGLFPMAKILAREEDYNIFSENGLPLVASAKASKISALPFKTYDKIEGDTMALIISAFSKLQKTDEGAALQIVLRPAGEIFFKKYSAMLDQLRKGDTLKRVLARESFLTDFFATVKDIHKASSESEKEKDKTKDKKREDEVAIEKISEKIKSTILDVNLRLIVSAKSLARSRSILNEMSSTFKQYSEIDGNSLDFKELEKNNLNQAVHNFIYRLWNSEESLPLNFKELATIYHLPTYIKDFSQIKSQPFTSVPAPLNLPQTGLFLGVNDYRHLHTKIFLPNEDRLRHLYIIGQTGTGKSVLLKNLILQDIHNGDGCCFIDPHGEDLIDILSAIPKERWDDVIYFDPANTDRPMGLNMLEYDRSKPEQKTFVINELFSIFKKLFGESSPESMGPAFEQYFRNSAGLVMEHPESGCTLMDISRVLSDKEYREYKLAHSKNPLINLFFKNAQATSGEQAFENFVPYVTNKFDIFVSNEIMRPIIAQEKSAFNIAEIMDQKKIFLVNLGKGRLGDINANLIGLILVGKFLMAALGRENPRESPPFYLYLDEFQNIATSTISVILSEARKYKLSLTLAHQYIGQLPEDIKNAVFGNVGSKIIFRVSNEDAKFLEPSFEPIIKAKDIMKTENLNAYTSLLINSTPQKPFNIHEEFSAKGSLETLETLKEMSYQKYGRAREEVEAEIMKKFQS